MDDYSTAEEIIARCRKIRQEMGERQQEINTLSGERRDLVLRLRDQFHLTTREIADQIAVSNPRVIQLLHPPVKGDEEDHP